MRKWLGKRVAAVKQWPRGKKLAALAVVVAALVLLVGLWLLSAIWRGAPVAAPFSRVGGQTRVETAVAASDLWLKPPALLVEIPSSASRQLMLDAADCAMVKDAPLLFTSTDPRRERLVRATIAAWRAASKGSAQPQPVRGCVAPGRSDLGQVSMLAATQPLVRLARIAPTKTLHSVVVFAAEWAPGDPPDVAIGMALAAHLAKTDGQAVSLVVVPRYLEADLGLENQLKDQRELVQGGVVLGSPSVLPEDTSALLRQLLRSVDQQGVLAQLENDLGFVGLLITALITLLGFGVVAAAAPVLIRDFMGIPQTYRGQAGRGTSGGPSSIGVSQVAARKAAGRESRNRGDTMAKSPPPQEVTDWLTELRKERKGAVTIWFGAGSKVNGTVAESDLGTVGTRLAVRLDNVTFRPEPAAAEEHAAYLLVPVDDIKMIAVDISVSSAPPIPPVRSDPP